MTASSDKNVIEKFLNEYCLRDENAEIAAKDLVYNINRITGSNYSMRGIFPKAMCKYILLNDHIRKKKHKTGEMHYTGIKFDPEKLEQAAKSNYVINEEKLTNVLSKITEINRSLKIIAKEYERAVQQDKIQSIIQYLPNYEPLFDDIGVLICPVKEESLPIIFDRRLNMEATCKQGMKLIRKIEDYKLKFFSQFESSGLQFPTLDVNILNLIKEGSYSQKTYEKLSKEHLKKIEF